MQLVSVERTEEYTTSLPTEPQQSNPQVSDSVTDVNMVWLLQSLVSLECVAFMFCFSIQCFIVNYCTTMNMYFSDAFLLILKYTAPKN